uniref:hypothetical protein n=1 Tax=Streptococcus pluranimalium TaxID=82348 RepID=UPI003F69059C
MSHQREVDYWQDEPVEEVENSQIDEGELTEQSSEDMPYDDTVEYDSPNEEYDSPNEEYEENEYYSDLEEDEEISLFDDEFDEEQLEQEHEEVLEEVMQTIKPSRFKFINTIKEKIAEEIVETTEQFVAEDDTIYQEKVARDELFLKRMLILAGIVASIVIILAVISLLLS